MAITTDGRSLATGSWDSTARLWDLDLEQLLERAGQVAGRELTPDEQKTYGLKKTEKSAVTR